MALSQEVIIAIIGVLINFPAAAIILWGLWRRRRRTNPSSDLENVTTSDDAQHPEYSSPPRQFTFDCRRPVALTATIPLISIATPSGGPGRGR